MQLQTNSLQEYVRELEQENLLLIDRRRTFNANLAMAGVQNDDLRIDFGSITIPAEFLEDTTEDAIVEK